MTSSEQPGYVAPVQWCGPIVRTAALLVALPGCQTRVYDHSEREQSRDAGTDRDDAQALDAEPPADVCASAADGTPCDDRDICTPSSLCRAGACFGENPYDSCVVADTEADFGKLQGEDGWWYGSWDAAHDADGHYDPTSDFEPMALCNDGAWLPMGRCASSSESDREWTMNLNSALQHAETRPFLELPVRRWLSDVSGPAQITAVHRRGGKAGDGTRALLLLDGVEIWRSEVTNPTMENRATLAVTLEQGSVLEQLLHPLADQADDMSYFSITIAP